MEFYSEDAKPPNARVEGVRLRLAQAFIDFLMVAYDALLFHRVNYKELPSYKDTTLLDEARKLPLEQGHDSFVTWMGRMKNDIRAAITRKGFKKV